MKKVFKIGALFFLTMSLTGCDWFDSDDDTSTSSGSGSVSTSTSSTTVYAAWYRGETNGGRPTWYYSKNMSSYPSTFKLYVSGCASGLTVTNNGSRWESGGYLVKQSDVSGRGMAVLAPSSCSSSTSYITY